MNNTFNINRFGLLLRRQWQEFGKIYLVSLLVLAGILICFYTINIPDRENTYGARMGLLFRVPVFLITGFLFISVVSSSYFTMMGQKPRAIIELMVPCSSLEKFLAGVLFSSFLAIFSYLFVFYLTDLFFIQYLETVFAGIKLPTHEADKVNFAEFTPFFSENNKSNTYPFYVLPFGISSLFLLGSVYFNRFHYIKTAGTVMIFGGVVIFLCYKTSRLLYNGKMRIVESEQVIRHSDRDWAMLSMTGVLILLTMILWFIGYVRLKEKEV